MVECMTTNASRVRPKGRAAASRITAAVWVLLTLAACQPERAVPVSFPDDPRVLHGSWQLTTTGLVPDTQRAVLSANGRSLLLVREERAWLYHREADGSWRKGDAAPYAAHLRAQVDPSLDALVTLERDGREVVVNRLSLADTSRATSTVLLPEGLTVNRLIVGSGRLFALLTSTAGPQQLHWFDLVSGVAEGSLVVPRHEDGMLVSANGRMLSFWDVRAGNVWLVDTAHSAIALRQFDLGVFCRGVGPGESSDDGRYFLASHCAGNLRVLDLHEQNPTWRAAGIKQQPFLRFARGDNRLVVWHDDAGRVRAHDLNSHDTVTLASGVRSGGYFNTGVLHLNASAGLVLADDGQGRVAVVSLDNPAERSSLPELPLSSANLVLSASDATTNPPTSSYTFTGTFEADGGPLELAGTVFSDRFHDYLTSAALPPPRLEGRAEVRPPGAGDGEALYRLEFSSEDRNADSYAGTLSDSVNELTYLVLLARPSP